MNNNKACEILEAHGLLTIYEAADRMGVSVRTIQRRVRDEPWAVLAKIGSTPFINEEWVHKKVSSEEGKTSEDTNWEDGGVYTPPFP